MNCKKTRQEDGIGVMVYVFPRQIGCQWIFLRIRLGNDLSDICSVPIGQPLAARHHPNFHGCGDMQSS